MTSRQDNLKNREEDSRPTGKLMSVTYISTYGYRCLNKGKGIPLEVGAEGRTNYIYQLLDNTGDNISYDNEYYGDLTALYWIWKNGEKNNSRSISFRHYNKYLVINEKKACTFLQNNRNGWIVAKATPNPPHHFPYEWNCFREIIKENYHIYYHALLELYDENDGSGNRCNCTNMFITSVEQLDNYCKVLFSICKDLRRMVGDTDHSRSDQRYCAFMAERFLSVYLVTHELPKLEADVCRSNRYLYWAEKTAKKIGFSGNLKYVKRIGKELTKKNYRSSYEDYR